MTLVFSVQIIAIGLDYSASKPKRKYGPPICLGTETNIIHGRPNEKHIATSHVERQNLTLQMHMRRFTRLTNAFSKKLENHCHAIALDFVYYNFVKQPKTLRVTSAMAADLTKQLMILEDIVKLIPEPRQSKRGKYKIKSTTD